jgi:hypothetical protein
MASELTDIAAAAANIPAAKLLFQKQWAIGGQEGTLQASGKYRFVAKDGEWRTDWDFSFVGQVAVQCQGSVSLRHRVIDKIIHAALSEKWPGGSPRHSIALVPIRVPVFDILDPGRPELEEVVSSRASLWWSLARGAQATLLPLKDSRENYLDYLRREDAWVYVYEPAVRFLVLLGADPDAAWRRAADRDADSGLNAAFFDWCERNRATVTAAAEEIYP